MKPTVGRIVHYHRFSDPKPVAAIITEVLQDGAAHLCVFLPQQLPGYVDLPVPFSETPKANHWSWPPRGDA